MRAYFCVDIGLRSSLETAAVRSKAEELATILWDKLNEANGVVSVEPVHCSHRSDNSPAIRILSSSQEQLGAALEFIASSEAIPAEWAHGRGGFPLTFSLRVHPDAEQ